MSRLACSVVRVLSAALLACAAACALAVPASAQTVSDAAASVVVVKVDGSIDGTIARYLLDRLGEAESSGATLVVQLDSAGTLDQDAVALATRIFEATVPVVVW